MKERRLVLRAGETARDVVLHAADRIAVDGREFTPRQTATGTFHLRSDAGTSIVYVVRDRNGFWVHAAGHVFHVETADASGTGRRRAAASDGPLSAPMPATVRAVLVEVGQAVRTGDTVLMLEAMKMELPIRAPRDGSVAAIHCREGQLVQPGVVLVELS